MKGWRIPVPGRVPAALAVFAAAVGVAVAAVSMRGDGETPSPRPYAHADVLHVFNATGIRDLQTGGSIEDHEPKRPDGYYVSVQGGGNWGATLFDDVSSAAAYETFIAKSLAESIAAEKKMWATNTTEPQWLSATVPAKSSAPQEKPKSLAARQESVAAQWSITRCANVVVVGDGNEPKRVCEALAKLPAALG